MDFAYSYWKRDSYDGCYASFVRYYRFMLKSNIEFASVHTGDLQECPAAKLREICDYVGMPYFEGKHRFWEHDHEHILGNPGTRKQVDKGDSKIRRRTSFPPAYAPIREKVEARVKRDETLQRILNALREREISQLPPTGPGGHRHGRPSLQFLLSQYYPRVAKQWYRSLRSQAVLRWRGTMPPRTG